MSISLTRNLKLKVSSDLSADARYNLQRIDELGATYYLDNNSTLNLRAIGDIRILPNDASVGGSGSGGNLEIGSASQALTSVTIYSDDISLSGAFGLSDTAVGGTKKLYLEYDSSISGGIDTSSDVTLSIDLGGSSRSLYLGSSFSLFSSFPLSLTTTAATAVTLPTTGTLSTLAGAEVLTNKNIDAAANSLSNIANASISNSAAIAYSKLALTNSIVNADVSASAAIVYSKLSLSNSLVNADINTSAAIAYSKLSLSNSILNSDINSAAGIAYSKLTLTGSLVNADLSASAAIARSKIASGTPAHVVINDGAGALSSTAFISTSQGGTGLASTATFPSSGVVVTEAGSAVLTNKTLSGASNTFSAIPYSALQLSGSIVNTDISASAAIAYSKLNLTGGIVNADVSASAAIAGSKINPDFGNQQIKTLDSLQFSEGGYTTTFQAAQSGQSANITFSLPPTNGTNGQVLTANGSGESSWQTLAGTGTVSSVDVIAPMSVFSVTGSPITTAGTIAFTFVTQSANTLFAGPTAGGAATPAFRALVAADVPSLPASQITSGQLAVARGGTAADLSATGGANQVVRQSTVGGAFTVSALASADIPNLDAAKITTGQLVVARGGTSADLSATGGTAQVLKQLSVGGPITVAALSASEIPNLPATIITSGQLALARGGTHADLSLTGGTGFVLKQSSMGADVSVAALIAADIPNLPASIITSGQLALARGGTHSDLSATGGTGFVLKQSSVGADVTVAALTAAEIPQLAHSSLSGLTSGDDHTQYALLAGRSGGQTLIGGTAAASNLTLQSTSNASRGVIIANDSLRLDNQGAIIFREAIGGGTDAITMQAPAALAASYTLTLPTTAGTADYVLTTNGSGTTTWTSIGSIVGYRKMSADWDNADGATKTITHNWNTRYVMVMIIDTTTNTMTMVDSIALGVNSVTLTASVAPSTVHRVLLAEIG